VITQEIDNKFQPIIPMFSSCYKPLLREKIIKLVSIKHLTQHN